MKFSSLIDTKLKEETKKFGFSQSKVISFRDKGYDRDFLIGDNYYYSNGLYSLSETVKSRHVANTYTLKSVGKDGFIGIDSRGHKVECLYIYPFEK